VYAALRKGLPPGVTTHGVVLPSQPALYAEQAATVSG
jgi:hypothetical protein